MPTTERKRKPSTGVGSAGVPLLCGYLIFKEPPVRILKYVKTKEPPVPIQALKPRE
jgi:hypothetical protein